MRGVARVSEDELLTRLKSRGRADDTEDVILNRMKVYRDETAPLLDYYASELKTVDAIGSPPTRCSPARCAHSVK